jgi:hypothetical protein
MEHGGAAPVGVQLYREPHRLQVGTDAGEVGLQGRLAPAYDYPVQQPAPVGQLCHHRSFLQPSGTDPNQAAVLTEGAAVVAALCEEDGCGPAGEIAERAGDEAADLHHPAPSR